jgi:uncharacterized protein YqgV (UPF0045/DUF77 family)
MSENTIIAKQGVEMTVTLETGHTETVLVKLLPLGKMPDFFGALDDDIAMIQLVTGKSKTFAEAIDFDSGMELIEKAHDVNFPRASRWAERKADRMGQLSSVAKKGIDLQRQLMS